MTTTAPADSAPHEAAAHKKTRWVWFAVVAMIIVAVVVAFIVVQANKPDPNARTVREASQGIIQKNPQEQTPAQPSHGGARLVELAAALGLPSSSLNGFAVTLEPSPQERAVLKENLERAVGARELTVSEANAVLKAYDRGLVSLPMTNYIADSDGVIGDDEWDDDSWGRDQESQDEADE